MVLAIYMPLTLENVCYIYIPIGFPCTADTQRQRAITLPDLTTVSTQNELYRLSISPLKYRYFAQIHVKHTYMRSPPCALFITIRYLHKPKRLHNPFRSPVKRVTLQHPKLHFVRKNSPGKDAGITQYCVELFINTFHVARYLRKLLSSQRSHAG